MISPHPRGGYKLNRKQIEKDARVAFSKANPTLQNQAYHGCKAAQSARKAWINGFVTETLKYAQ